MEAVIFVGIQGSGKSSFYKERFFNTHVRINLDMLRTKHRQQVIFNACLEAKQPFVVDNTNINAQARACFIISAKAAGFRVTGYYFHSDVKAALLRNSRRIGISRVPDKALLGTYRKLQVPSRAEGFDALYYVRINEAGEFLVKEGSYEIC